MLRNGCPSAQIYEGIRGIRRTLREMSVGQKSMGIGYVLPSAQSYMGKGRIRRISWKHANGVFFIWKQEVDWASAGYIITS